MSNFNRKIDIIKLSPSTNTEKFQIVGIVDPFGFIYLNKEELSLLYIEIHKTLFSDINSKMDNWTNDSINKI